MTAPQARIGRTIAESTAAFPPVVRAPDGAPNVVVIVLDDLGFGQLGCFGSDIATPAIDALATNGLRYNRFHVTALCSPTRACLLTGRNHHAVGMGFLTDIPIGFPGYDGRIPPSAGTLPRILRDAGYNAFAVGKWHLTPRWDQSASGPFTRWPLGLGFERYYGFLAGDTNQWTPELVQDNQPVEPPRRPEEGYHLTEDLVDRAIRYVRDQHHATPEKPFFLYLATGAMHAPHQAPDEWIEPYRGRFDAGWEVWREHLFARQLELGVVPPGTELTERPPWVASWNGLASDERRLFARQMEVFAGFLSHTDHQIGRLLEFLRATELLDDTLVMLISDNGTSAEGGPVGSLNEHRFTHDMVDDVADSIAHIDDFGGFRGYNHYAWGWAWAGNTPLRLWKRYTWLGGVRTPLIAHWP
ncbi:MAG: arylsulfatase, partial [Acidimicrobiia bacterium]